MTSKKTQQTQPLFNLGDTFEFDGEQVKVVELLESGNVHLKKIDPPYSSFIVTEGEAKQGGRKVSTEDVKRLTKALDEAIDTFGKERLAKVIVEASKED